VIVLALLGGGGGWLYHLSQQQYYVDVDGDEVVIYQGVDLPLLSSVYERTGLMVPNLPTNEVAVRGGSPSDGLKEALAYVSRLRDSCVKQLPKAVTVPDEPPFWPPWLQTDARYQSLVSARCGP
jgi:hypothetical protein